MGDLSESSPPDGFMFEYAESEVVVVDLLGSDIPTYVVPLMVQRGVDDDGRAEGSAFCIASFTSGQAIFVTARHVVECLYGHEDFRAFIVLPRGLDSDEARLDPQPVPVQLVSLPPDSFSDVALLVVNVADGPTPAYATHLEVSLGEPALGQDCVGLGYPQEPERGTGQYILCAATGVIEEVHPNRRDNAMSTFPSFRTTGKYLHGMSGGPIIGANGRVIGVIAHGMDSPTTGYGACIAGIIELRVTLRGEDGTERKVQVAELVSCARNSLKL